MERGERMLQEGQTPVPLFVLGGGHDALRNIAFERALMDAVRPGECVLYLWRNSPSVIVGRNQNVWRECRVDALKRDGVALARRLSGGGAVYHDLGNLNFTFIAHEGCYDVPRQLEVVARAVRSFGVDVRVSGRNDLEVDGAKFSGNAFYKAGDVRYHHGTLMVSVDTARLVGYLVPDERKLAAKGVASVRSRVVNLCELVPAVTVEQLVDALVAAFGEEYLAEAADGSADAAGAAEFDCSRVGRDACERYYEQLSSWDWVYGRTPRFTHTVNDRFAWGGVEVGLVVEHGIVADARVYSDALDADLIAQLARALQGRRYAPESLREACTTLSTNPTTLADLQTLLSTLE